jgi:hypothetical protein
MRKQVKLEFPVEPILIIGNSDWQYNFHGLASAHEVIEAAWSNTEPGESGKGYLG